MSKTLAVLLARVDPGDPATKLSWETCAPDGVATLRCLPLVLKNVINASLTFCGVVAVVFIIWSGIKLIQSKGDPKQVQGAKQILTYALIGLIVVLLSFTVVNFISVITGTECIQTFGFDSCK